MITDKGFIILCLNLIIVFMVKYRYYVDIWFICFFEGGTRENT